MDGTFEPYVVPSHGKEDRRDKRLDNKGAGGHSERGISGFRPSPSDTEAQ